MQITRSYAVIIESDEDGIFVATAPAFPGVVDQGATEEETLENVRQALDFTLADMVENGEDVPPSDAGRKVVREVDLAV